MDENKVRQIIREEMSRNDNKTRFGVTPVAQVRQNQLNVSSNPQSVINYIGFVPYDGGTDSTLKFLLPVGWNVVHEDTGQYSITHNLGTQIYSMVITPTQSTNQAVFPIIDPFSNSVDISFLDTTPNFQDTSFNFILTQVNNRVTAFPKYQIRNPLSFGNI